MPLDLIEDSIMYVFEDILERIENKKNDYQRYNFTRIEIASETR